MKQPARVMKTYDRVRQQANRGRTVINVSGKPIGGNEIAIFAGPCSVETEEQVWSTARWVHSQGAQFFRAGAYKPATYPYAFRGHGRDALRLLQQVSRELDLPVVTEVMDPRDVEEVVEFADILQIGTRNSQNYRLLSEVGKTRKPVFLKRGTWMTLDEFLGAAEYIAQQGNDQVILCERGILSPTLNTPSNEKRTRWRLDLQIVPELKQRSHLPVVVDPSHGTGDRDFVTDLARAGVAVGADGLMIETHPFPDESISDSAQALSFEAFADLMKQVGGIARAMGRSFPVASEATLSSTTAAGQG